LQELQPRVNAIKEKYKDNKEEQARQMMAFYKENKVNPMSGCLPILIQLPILIALYQVFLKGFNPDNLNVLYSFVANPGVLDPFFLGKLDLSLPSRVVAVLAGLSQFWQSKMITPPKKLAGAPKSSDEFMAQAMSRNMLYFLPIFTVVISWSLPSGLALYWLVTTIFTVAQQYVTIRPIRNSASK
jgi:YidC/Oxa1 family membrane protein insertase